MQPRQLLLQYVRKAKLIRTCLEKIHKDDLKSIDRKEKHMTEESPKLPQKRVVPFLRQYNTLIHCTTIHTETVNHRVNHMKNRRGVLWMLGSLFQLRWGTLVDSQQEELNICLSDLLRETKVKAFCSSRGPERGVGGWCPWSSDSDRVSLKTWCWCSQGSVIAHPSLSVQVTVVVVQQPPWLGPVLSLRVPGNRNQQPTAAASELKDSILFTSPNTA